MSVYYFSFVNVSRSGLGLDELRNEHSLKYKDTFLFLSSVVPFFSFFLSSWY